MLVLQLLHKCLGVLAVDKHLESLDVLFVVLHALAQSLHVVRESRRFRAPFVLNLLAALSISNQCTLKLLQLPQVLVLHLSILHLNDVELLFVLAGCFAEAGSELVGLLGVELLRVVAVLFLLLADGVHLLLQGFVLDLS